MIQISESLKGKIQESPSKKDWSPRAIKQNTEKNTIFFSNFRTKSHKRRMVRGRDKDILINYLVRHS